jgi:thioredoxin-like negative regulator of GroEL
MLAFLFAVALNFGLMATFVWPEMVSPLMRMLGWSGVLTFWGVAGWLGLREFAKLRGPSIASQEQGLFVLAQAEYLKGHWLEAETALRKLIELDERDGDARLMLASLLRHSGRIDEAQMELDGLELSEAGLKWALEIARERRLGLAAVTEPSA